jgi:hypothetical protein
MMRVVRERSGLYRHPFNKGECRSHDSPAPALLGVGWDRSISLDDECGSTGSVLAPSCVVQHCPARARSSSTRADRHDLRSQNVATDRCAQSALGNFGVVHLVY